MLGAHRDRLDEEAEPVADHEVSPRERTDGPHPGALQRQQLRQHRVGQRRRRARHAPEHPRLVVHLPVLGRVVGLGRRRVSVRARGRRGGKSRASRKAARMNRIARHLGRPGRETSAQRRRARSPGPRAFRVSGGRGRVKRRFDAPIQATNITPASGSGIDSGLHFSNSARLAGNAANPTPYEGYLRSL